VTVRHIIERESRREGKRLEAGRGNKNSIWSKDFSYNIKHYSSSSPTAKTPDEE